MTNKAADGGVFVRSGREFADPLGGSHGILVDPFGSGFLNGLLSCFWEFQASGPTGSSGHIHLCPLVDEVVRDAG